jgi:nitrogen fixation/metabolism regulation signal transduction histidine kinase
MSYHPAEHATSDLSRGASRARPSVSTVDAAPLATEPLVNGIPGFIATLMVGLPVGVLLLATDGALTYANDAARDFWATAHAGSASADFDAIVTRALLAGEIVRGEQITLNTRNHRERHDWLRWRHFLVNATPLSVARDGMDGIVMTVEDVTARTEMDRFRPMIESLARL